MGLDCNVYQSDLSPEELAAWVVKAAETETWDSETIMDELWYGRKTHQIMTYLLQDYIGDNNCEFISIDHFSTEDLKALFQREVILPTLFTNEGELEDFKALVDALESHRDEDKYLYFYAWY